MWDLLASIVLLLGIKQLHLCTGILMWINLKLGNEGNEPEQGLKSMPLLFSIRIKDLQVMAQEYLTKTRLGFLDHHRRIVNTLVMEGLTGCNRLALLQDKVSHLVSSNYLECL